MQINFLLCSLYERVKTLPKDYLPQNFRLSDQKVPKLGAVQKGGAMYCSTICPAVLTLSERINALFSCRLGDLIHTSITLLWRAILAQLHGKVYFSYQYPNQIQIPTPQLLVLH